jgi:hypothetical protein
VLVAATAGASAGVAVVAFTVMPWPVGFVVLPILAAWSLLLSALLVPGGWKRRANVLALTAAAAVVLGAALLGLLSLLGP